MHEPVTKRHPMIDMEEFERRLRQSSGNQTDDDTLAELARLISGQQDSFQRFAEPQGQGSAEARQMATPSPEAQETEAQEPDAPQNLDDDNMACHDSGNVNEEIASRRSLYIMIMATIIIVGMVGIGASFGYRNGASPPPEIATISENGPAKPQLEKTSRSDVPTPDTSILGAAPQPSPVTVVNNVEEPGDPLQPRETMPAAGIAASPEQIETQIEPSGQTAPIAPEKMDTASVERHNALMNVGTKSPCTERRCSVVVSERCVPVPTSPDSSISSCRWSVERISIQSSTKSLTVAMRFACSLCRNDTGTKWRRRAQRQLRHYRKIAPLTWSSPQTQW